MNKHQTDACIQKDVHSRSSSRSSSGLQRLPQTANCLCLIKLPSDAVTFDGRVDFSDRTFLAVSVQSLHHESIKLIALACAANPSVKSKLFLTSGSTSLVSEKRRQYNIKSSISPFYNALFTSISLIIFCFLHFFAHINSSPLLSSF